MRRANRRVALGAVRGAFLSACRSRGNTAPTIEFTRIPQTDPGGKEKNDIIEGIVKGGRPGQRIVLYARSGKWWVQPLRNNPFTRVQASGKWTNATHLGAEYAALLVEPGFRPPPTYDALPPPGGDIALAALEKAKDRSANGKGRGRCSTTITRKWYARITALFAGLLGYSVTLNGKY